MIRLLSAVFFASCASTPSGPYLFPRAKQKHEVKVYGPQGELHAQSLNFLVVDENEARVTSLTPASLTAMKAVIYKNKKAELIYLSPLLEEQRSLVEALLKKLSRLLWLRQSQVSSELSVLKANEDGSLRELEWKIAQQKIVIKVETL